MAYSIEDKTRVLMKSEKAVAVIEEFFPGATADKKLKLAANMPFKAVIGYFPEPPKPELIAALNEKLGAIEE